MDERKMSCTQAARPGQGQQLKLSVLFTGILLVLGSAASLAGPVAVVAHKVGNVQSAAGPLRLAQTVNEGDTISCGSGAEATIVYFSGKQFRIGPGGRGAVGASGITGSGVSGAGTVSGPSAGAAAALAGGRRGGIGARGTPAPRRFAAGIPGWVSEGNLHFSWQPAPDAVTYNFAIFDPSGALVWSTPTRLTKPEVDYPADGPSLALNKPYLWYVSPFGKNFPQPRYYWGVVTVLPKADSEALIMAAYPLELSLLQGKLSRLQDQVKGLQTSQNQQQITAANLQDQAGSLSDRLKQLQDQVAPLQAAGGPTTEPGYIQLMQLNKGADDLRVDLRSLMTSTKISTPIKLASTDRLPGIVLASLYERYGVLQLQFETLDNLAAEGEPGAAEAVTHLCQQLGPFGQAYSDTFRETVAELVTPPGGRTE